MQNEDDLRGLAKTADFMRAVSILVVLMNFYYFCYVFFQDNHFTLNIIDKILTNFQQTSGLFNNTFNSKLFAFILLCLSCMGRRGVKNEKITWFKINSCIVSGGLLFFLNWWIFCLSQNKQTITILYIATTSIGYILLLVAGTWISRLLKHKMIDDPFNDENESFMQEMQLIENEYSINLPTKFWYKKKEYRGWINVINPFRAIAVLGTPGSGKTYAIINNIIKQEIEKGYTMFIYDFKFPDLSIIAYNHLINNTKGYKKIPHFYVINFDDPRRSHRCNPLNPQLLNDITDAYESSFTIMLNLNRSWISKQGDFFVESPIVLFTALIWFLKIYQNGQFCTFPHCVELLNKPY